MIEGAALFYLRKSLNDDVVAASAELKQQFPDGSPGLALIFRSLAERILEATDPEGEADRDKLFGSAMFIAELLIASGVRSLERAAAAGEEDED